MVMSDRQMLVASLVRTHGMPHGAARDTPLSAECLALDGTPSVGSRYFPATAFTAMDLPAPGGPTNTCSHGAMCVCWGATMGQVCFTAISSNRACPTVFIALSSV